MQPIELFGLTESQLHILNSIEYMLVGKDIDRDKKYNPVKCGWRFKWEKNLNITQGDGIAIPFRNDDALIDAIKAEYEKSPNKTWLYLVMLEASLFRAYTPLGDGEVFDKEYAKLKYKNDLEYLKRISYETAIIDPDYIDRFTQTYSKAYNKLSGKWKNLAIGALSVVAASAVAAATAGAAAPAIAVALFGNSFVGLSGAALTAACLAMAGGGAIAAGGLGMTGGIIAIVGGGALLGAAGSGAALSATALLIHSSPSFTLSQAAKLEVVLKEITLNSQRDIHNAQVVMDALKARVLELESALTTLKLEQAKDKEKLSNMEKSLKILKEAYKDMNAFKSAYEIGKEIGEDN